MTPATETPLRYFPHVLVIDTEGNTDQCVNMPEIPEFLRVQTKDARKIFQIIDAAANGDIKFPDGSPVETVAIDSISVLWSVGQEAAAAAAEARALKYHKSLDEATPAMSDWNIAKRPIKRIYNRLSNSPIKYLFLISREKDKYEQNGTNAQDIKKDGFTFDAMKGIDYDMNIAFRLGYDANKKWYAEVTKVQGALSKILPLGKQFKEFPTKEIMDYTAKIKAAAGKEDDEEEMGRKLAKSETTDKEPHDKQALITFAKENGIFSPEAVGDILKANGLVPYDEANWDRMTDAILAAKPG